MKSIISALALLVASNAFAGSIVVGTGEHQTVNSAVDSVILEEGAALSVRAGADIGQIRAGHNSDIDITGGEIDSFLHFSEGRHNLNISGGDIGDFVADSTFLDISGGTFGTSLIQDAWGDISGGTFNGPPTNSCSRDVNVGLCFQLDFLITITGGVFNTAIGVSTLSPNFADEHFRYGLVFEGYGLSLTQFEFGEGMGHLLTGTLRDGTPINTEIYGLRDYDGLHRYENGFNEIRLVEVPEPAALSLMLLGLLLMRARKRRV